VTGFAAQFRLPSQALPAIRRPHRRLLLRPRRRFLLQPPRRAAVDGIVVPTVRLAHHLEQALTLAAKLTCPVVALCSGSSKATTVNETADRVGFDRCTPVDIEEGYGHPLLKFDTSDFKVALPPFRNLSLKRNIGLLLAKLVGWETLLFLDDDVRGLVSNRVRTAAGQLDHVDVTAFAMTDFPDNSVVCHAYRLGRGKQDVFVSGGVCLVKVSRIETFFPAVYNEDWLFLFDALKERLVARAGKVNQLPYDPFATPARARSEEFGDVLAEGLFALIHADRSFANADCEYWSAYLEGRKSFIARTTSMVSSKAGHNPQAKRALRALTAAEDYRRTILPQELAEYVTTWREDVDAWRSRLRSLPRLPSLEDALRYLDLEPPEDPR
jgi:hypothetical protein